MCGGVARFRLKHSFYLKSPSSANVPYFCPSKVATDPLVFRMTLNGLSDALSPQSTESHRNDVTEEAGAYTGGSSQDQEVKKRKHSECGERVKKRKLKEIEHSLHAMGESIEEMKNENDLMTQELHLRQVEMERHVFDLMKNMITTQENLVETILQHPIIQQLMPTVQDLSSPNANWDDSVPMSETRQLDGIANLKLRMKMVTMLIEVLCEIMIK